MIVPRPTLAVCVAAALATACATRAPVTTTEPPPPPAPAGPVAAPTPPPRPEPPTAPPSPVTQAPESPPPAPTPPAPPATPPGAAPRSTRQIVLNFDNADIEAVIQAASEIVGFNYILGPGVSGKKVTVQTSGRIPEDEVLNVLLAVLEINGVTMIRAGSLYKIVPIAGARERPLATIVGAQPDPTRRDDELIMQIVPMVHSPAERIAAAIRQFVQGGNVTVHGNLVIITDTAANITRVLQIIALFDTEVALEEVQIIPVRYADAGEVAAERPPTSGSR